MTSLKRPQRDMQVAPAAPGQPGPAPSANLLAQFGQEAERKRMEAGDCRVTASTAAEAAKSAQADVARFEQQLGEILTQVEKIRGVIAERTSEADAHRDRAAEYAARAAELLNDAAYLDERVARAANAVPVCSCTIPGAPDAAERAAACPVHATAPTVPERDDGGEGAVR